MVLRGEGPAAGEPSGATDDYGRALEDPKDHVEVHVPRYESGLPAGTSEATGEEGKRAERTVAFLFLLAAAGSFGFIVSYLVFREDGVEGVRQSNFFLGLSMSVAFFAAGAGIIHWIRKLMPYQDVVQQRGTLASPAEDRQAVFDYFKAGGEATGITRRPLLRRSLLAALLPLGVAPVFLLGDLGPLPGDRLRHTVWRRGLRLVLEDTGEPLRPGDLTAPGSLATVVPEGYEDDPEVLAYATAIVLKLRPSDYRPPTKVDQTVDGIIAYSKICTHAGCPAGLYEDGAKTLLCPCHQSTFDATRAAAVVFGPATRPLPQLPIGVDSEGYLIALDDYPEPVGPNFWERGR